LALPSNPKTDSESVKHEGWNVVVRRVHNPEAVREGRRVMGELLIQALLNTHQAEPDVVPRATN